MIIYLKVIIKLWLIKYDLKKNALLSSYVANDISFGEFFQHNYNRINYVEKVNYLILKPGELKR